MDKKELQFELDLLLADRMVNTHYFDNAKCIDWAISLMELGLESTSIDILAGLDTDDLYAVEDYLKKAIQDLDLIDNKTSEELFQLYIVYIATQSIEGKIPPFKALDILRSIHIYGYDYDFSTEMLRSSADLSESISLIGEYELFYLNLTDENKEEAILNEMKLLLYNISKGFPIVRNLIYCKACNDFSTIIVNEKGCLFKSAKIVCNKCSSTDFMYWNDVSNQKKILKLITEK